MATVTATTTTKTTITTHTNATYHLQSSTEYMDYLWSIATDPEKMMVMAVTFVGDEDLERRTVSKAIELGGKINERLYSGWTPLHFAAYRGREAMAKHMVEVHGA